jgi:hypothetical protein
MRLTKTPKLVTKKEGCTDCKHRSEAISMRGRKLDGCMGSGEFRRFSLYSHSCCKDYANFDYTPADKTKFKNPGRALRGLYIW